MTDALINTQAVKKTFQGPHGPVHAVDHIDLRIKPGEFVMLHGPSGCGKTTLLLMLGGLLSPDAGAIEICEKNPYKMSANQRAHFRAKHIGFVFQQFHLVPYLNVMDNVLISELTGVDADQRERATLLLNEFQLGDRLDHVPSALSVGEQQRVALARALLLEPPVVLADEPTGNLDEENSELVMQALSGWAKDGHTVVMVTHDENARKWGTRNVKLKQGQLTGK